MKKLKIAIFTDVYLEVAGGIASSIRAQKKDLEALGHEVTVFCPGKVCNEKGVEVLPTHKLLRFNKAPVSLNPKKVQKCVLQKHPDFDFDVVHVHYEASASIGGMLLAKRFKKPLVTTMHGREDSAIAVNIPHPFKNLVGMVLNFLHSRYIPHPVTVKKDDYLATSVARAKLWTIMVNHANFADVVITPSAHFKNKFRYYGVKKKIEIVSNALNDDKKITSSVRKWDGEGDLKLIWNSRLSKEKRIMEFLKALNGLDHYEFHVFGTGNEFKMAKAYALTHKMNVKFYGAVPRDEILKKMQECHLSVMTSYNFDNQPMTLLEASFTGLPVFFCDADMKEVVPKGGYVFSGGPDKKEMHRAMEKVFAKPELIEKMSRTMIEKRSVVLQEVWTKKLLEIYQNVIAAEVASKD